jgi:hypothetical protein
MKEPILNCPLIMEAHRLWLPMNECDQLSENIIQYIKALIIKLIPQTHKIFVDFLFV